MDRQRNQRVGDVLFWKRNKKRITIRIQSKSNILMDGKALPAVTTGICASAAMTDAVFGEAKTLIDAMNERIIGVTYHSKVNDPRNARLGPCGRIIATIIFSGLAC